LQRANIQMGFLGVGYTGATSAVTIILPEAKQHAYPVVSWPTSDSPALTVTSQPLVITHSSECPCNVRHAASISQSRGK